MHHGQRAITCQLKSRRNEWFWRIKWKMQKRLANIFSAYTVKDLKYPKAVLTLTVV